MNCTAILVNWNAGIQLAEAVASLARFHQGRVAAAVIVDNASTDDSLVRIAALTDLPFPLHVIRNPTNRGFAAACNQGAARADADGLLFLNPDTRLFADSLAVPLAYLQDPAHATIGIAGIQLVDAHDHVARSCARFPTLAVFIAQAMGASRLPGLRRWNTHMTDWSHDRTTNVDHVIGAFYLIRRALFTQLGGFDERFFMYLEDLDLSQRAARAGFRCAYLTEARAFHAGGGTSHQVQARRLFYALRSRLLYAFKHLPPWQGWVLLTVTLLLEPISRSVSALCRGNLRAVGHTGQALGLLYGDLPRILAARRP